MSLVMVGLLFAGLSYAAIDPAIIAGMWVFDEGSGAVAGDSSGNGNDGELVGDPQWVAGKFGSALEFDGDGDYVTIPDSDSLDMADQITIACWFKTDKAMLVFDDRQALLGKHYLEYELGVYSGGAIHTYTNDGSGGYDEGINASIAEELTEDEWVTGKWYHVAWVLNGMHETVFVNGINIGEFDKGHPDTLPGDHPLEIGERVGGSLPFTGAIDEVIVLNAAIKEADVQDLMFRGILATAVSPARKLATAWGDVKTR